VWQLRLPFFLILLAFVPLINLNTVRILKSLKGQYQDIFKIFRNVYFGVKPQKNILFSNRKKLFSITFSGMNQIRSVIHKKKFISHNSNCSWSLEDVGQ